MNIAFVLPAISDRIGGPVCMVKNTGACLSTLGHQVSYWATGTDADREQLASTDSAYIFKPTWPYCWFRSKELAPKLSVKIPSINILHINSFWPHSTYVASRIARHSHTPYLLRPAGVFMHPWRYNGFKKKSYLSLLGNRILKNAACIQVSSEMEAHCCREAGLPGSITIIPNGIDSLEFETLPGISEAEAYWPNLKDRFVLLFLSRISPEKGLDQCLPALREVIDRKKETDILFVIAGPDHKGHLKNVKQQVRDLCLDPYVFFPGMVTGEAKKALYRRSDVFVLPSYSENFGIVVTEALACETPVITTTGTPWQELQDIDAGRWVPPNKTELAEALCEMVDMSPQQRDMMGRRGREHVIQNYTWDTTARKLQTVYQCILDGDDIPQCP
ncbi:MAG: glycosyltransferase [Planctomycetes bacterium]|nr:glycosyltransferase [Planctomycetota bacterium]